jgi:hypothetical protein
MRKIILLLILIQISYAEDTRRDGNWWIQQDKNTKYTYVVGFFDGLGLGNRFSYWEIVEKPSASNTKCAERAAKSFSNHINKYLRNVPNNQISEGLDSLYSDFKNRKIMTSDGFWIVVNQISGVSNSEMDEMILNYRKYAN